jgi:hypothetical protein
MTVHNACAREIAAVIEGYLRSHPHSSDSVEGVVWWIPELALQPRALVLEALDGLVERSVAVRKQRDDGTVTYQLRTDRDSRG